MGIEYPSTGILTVLGRPIKSNNGRNIRKIRRNIGPVFQEFEAD